MRKTSWQDALWYPRSLVLFGVSRDPRGVGHCILSHLRKCDYRGSIYLIHPEVDEIEGVQAHRRLDQIEEDIDLALLMVPRSGIEGCIDQCIAAGLKAGIVITAGFSEHSDEGEALEARLVEKAATGGMRLLGPNCLGLVHTHDDVRLQAAFSAAPLPSGTIGFLSQSGALGSVAMAYMASRKLGFSAFASLGNRAMIGENDLLPQLAKDDRTRAILLYLESFQDFPTFADLAEEITRAPSGKPILVLKAGRSQKGQEAASSHTGALAARDDVLDELLWQRGVIRVTSMEAMMNAGALLASQPMPGGPRLLIITNAGGQGLLATDSAVLRGLALPDLSEALREVVTGHLSALVDANNPLDILGDADSESFRRVLERAMEAEAYDAILVIATQQAMTDLEAIADAIAESASLAHEQGITLTASLGVWSDSNPAVERLKEAGVPHFAAVEQATEALDIAWRCRQAQRQGEPPSVALPALPHEAIQALLAQARRDQRHHLLAPDCLGLFEQLGFAVTPWRLARSPADVSRASQALPYPLAMATLSRDIIHKTRSGLVRKGICREADAIDAYEALLAQTHAEHPDAAIEGIALQTQQLHLQQQVSVILGTQRNEHYGQMLMCGLGGRLSETMGDVSFRAAPLSRNDAEEMITSLDCFPYLQGLSEQAASLFAHGLLRLSQLVSAYPDIVEIDLNPVILVEDTLYLSDARIMLAEPDPPT